MLEFRENARASRKTQLERLEDHLGDLAALWRGTQDPNIIREYQAILQLMCELGWDGPLDFESALPTKYMPEKFSRR